MARVLRFSEMIAAGFLAGGILWMSAGSLVHAQSGKSKAKPKPASAAEVKKLDARLEEVQGSFLRDTASIIKGYEDTGQLDRAKTLLEVLLKLDPKNEQIKKKMDQLNEQMLDLSEFDMELDPAKPWQQVGLVTKDRLIRLEVEGDYKFVASLPVGPEGFSTKDAASDLVGGVPLGAVVAVILPAGGGDQGNNGKAPNPFGVGAKYEQNAKADGALLLKVNVPPGAKCTGKLKVKVSGVLKG